MKLEDDIDFALLDLQSKVSFGTLDWINKQKREYRLMVEQIKVWRTSNPTLFDQIAIVGLAAILEVVVSYLKRD